MEVQTDRHPAAPRASYLGHISSGDSDHHPPLPQFSHVWRGVTASVQCGPEAPELRDLTSVSKVRMRPGSSFLTEKSLPALGGRALSGLFNSLCRVTTSIDLLPLLSFMLAQQNSVSLMMQKLNLHSCLSRKHPMRHSHP